MRCIHRHQRVSRRYPPDVHLCSGDAREMPNERHPAFQARQRELEGPVVPPSQMSPATWAEVQHETRCGRSSHRHQQLLLNDNETLQRALIDRGHVCPSMIPPETRAQIQDEVCRGRKRLLIVLCEAALPLRGRLSLRTRFSPVARADSTSGASNDESSMKGGVQVE